MAQDQLEDALAPYYRSYIPDGIAPYPTVLLVSGCSGFEHPRAPLHYFRIAERLRSEGNLVLFVDYVRARKLPTACSGAMSSAEVGDYALAAVEHARAMSVVDVNDLRLIGWSLGGGGVLAATQKLSRTNPRALRAAVALYPVCRDLHTLVSDVPTLMLLAGSDAIQPPALCHELVNRAADRMRIVVRTYAHAHHGFDMMGLPFTPVPGLPPLAFDSAAAEAAWKEVSEFIGPIKRLRSGSR